MINKGLVSYRDPESAPGRGQKTLNVTRDMDLTKMFVKCLRELADPKGSTLTRIEGRIRNMYIVQVASDYFKACLIYFDESSRNKQFSQIRSLYTFRKAIKITRENICILVDVHY